MAGLQRAGVPPGISFDSAMSNGDSLLWLTDKLLSAFEIDSFGSLLVSSLVITLVNGAFHIALHPHVYRTFTHPGAPPRCFFACSGW